jgi:hypothetical protein
MIPGSLQILPDGTEVEYYASTWQGGHPVGMMSTAAVYIGEKKVTLVINGQIVATYKRNPSAIPTIGEILASKNKEK